MSPHTQFPSRPQAPRLPAALARLRGQRPATGGRPGSEFDSAEPDDLVRRLDASDCFCRDTKAGRLYHPKETSFREITSRDSLHVTVREGNTVTTHIDRHSPLARRQSGGECRYSPLRIAAHNVTGAVGDLLRLTIGRRESPADHLVDDQAVSETVTSKEVAGEVVGDEPRASSDRPALDEVEAAMEQAGWGTWLERDRTCPPHNQTAGDPSRP
ncbi:MAG: hypothetical protein M3507_11020 [Actinomycetota bacterium]|nr:hypothetical protein [Actinomycetota bacterium]